MAPSLSLFSSVKLEFIKRRLVTEFDELKKRYVKYKQYPDTHPMYAKEWRVFYLRRSSELFARKK